MTDINKCKITCGKRGQKLELIEGEISLRRPRPSLDYGAIKGGGGGGGGGEYEEEEEEKKKKTVNMG